jgi:hypothetical protein
MADALPPHHTFDDAINLKDATDPPWGPIYTRYSIERMPRMNIGRIC